jgi:hypothetical protein
MIDLDTKPRDDLWLRRIMVFGIDKQPAASGKVL